MIAELLNVVILVSWIVTIYLQERKYHVEMSIIALLSLDPIE